MHRLGGGTRGAEGRMMAERGWKGWFQWEEQQRPEIEDHRRELLDRVFRPFIVLGLLALGLGSWRAIREEQHAYAAVYLGLYALCVALAVGFKRLSVRMRSWALVAGLFGIAVAGLLRLGLSGVGVLVFVACGGLAAIVRGAKASLWVVGLITAVLLMAGQATIHGLISFQPGQLETSYSLGAWIGTAVTFVGVTVGLIIPFHSLNAMLARSLDSLESQADELERSNQQLRAEVERRQQAEEALRASEYRYRSIFESASVSIWEQDVSGARAVIDELRAEGIDDVPAYLGSHPEWVRRALRAIKVRDVNRATLETYGARSKKELLQSIDEIIVPESLPGFAAVLGALAEGQRRFEGESINGTLQGERIHLIVRAAIPEDVAEPMLVSVLDITDRKLLEQSLAQAKKMEAIGALAGGVAHDFNNLLQGIQGFVSVMLRHTREPTLQQHLDSIAELVQSGASLTGQLLGFARGGKYDVQTTDLGDLLSHSLTIFARARKEVRTHCELPEELWTVDVDRAQLEQVLLNLYLNAWHAMPGGGELTLAASNVTRPSGREQPAGPEQDRALVGDCVRIAVTDTGTGMDDETRERVFEPFFTTRGLGQGTGLGLASAYGIITNHGGTLDVRSEVDRGSTFVIHLPASKKSIPPPEPPAAEREGSETVLLVDDERAVREVTAMMLEELGYEVLAAGDGARAIELYEAHGDGIAVVILDMIMPGMGGPEVWERLRALSGTARVLLSSGYSLDEKADQLLQTGCQGFLQKPFELTTLSAKLREILDADPPA